MGRDWNMIQMVFFGDVCHINCCIATSVVSFSASLIIANVRLLYDNYKFIFCVTTC